MLKILIDAVAVIGILDEQYRAYGIPAQLLNNNPLLFGTIHAWIFRTGHPVQLLEMIACHLDDEYYDGPSADCILSGIVQVLATTYLREYRLVTAATTLRRSRTAAAA
jgi:hypothetical protein